MHSNSVTTPGRKYNSPVLLYIDLAGNWNFRLSGYFRYLISPSSVLIVRLSFPPFSSPSPVRLKFKRVHTTRSPPFFDEMDSSSEIVSKTWDIFPLLFAIGAATITNITFDANNWILIALEIANISFEIRLMLLNGSRVF